MARFTKEGLNRLAFGVATDAQRAQLAQYVGAGWYPSKVSGLSNSPLRSIFLAHDANGAAAVILPCGKVERQTANRTSLKIDLRTMTRVGSPRRGIGSY